MLLVNSSSISPMNTLTISYIDVFGTLHYNYSAPQFVPTIFDSLFTSDGLFIIIARYSNGSIMLNKYQPTL